MGVAGHFKEIYGADFMGDLCKPEKVCVRKYIDRSDHDRRLNRYVSSDASHIFQEAFEKVLAALPAREGEERTQQLVLFEDSFKNLMAAKDFGMKTVLIRTCIIFFSTIADDDKDMTLEIHMHTLYTFTDSETVEEEGRSEDVSQKKILYSRILCPLPVLNVTHRISTKSMLWSHAWPFPK